MTFYSKQREGEKGAELAFEIWRKKIKKIKNWGGKTKKIKNSKIKFKNLKKNDGLGPSPNVVPSLGTETEKRRINMSFEVN
jgi:hypothetical protein